jgi:mono/diheme cytochrome c family protein
MKPWIRWALGSVAALLAVATTAVVAGQAVAERRMHRKVDVQVPSGSLPGDASALDRGRYLYASRGCADCHGSDGAGRRFIDDAALRVRAPHISPGPGSVTAAYRTDDWVRTIRHGVKPDGSPAMIMPSEDYNRMTDADLGALVAYMRQMPAVDGGGADLQLGLPVRLLYAAGVVQDAAAKIDHTLPPQQPVAEGPTPEHGRYVANMCLGCHGESLSGGPIAGAPPDWPAAANLTSGAGGVMSRYASADAFAAMLKSGRRPDGSAIAVMPFGSLAALNDVDVRALHAYLQTLEPRATGTK